MLHQHRIACDQLRPRNPGRLVQGKVPRLGRQQGTQRFVHQRRAPYGSGNTSGSSNAGPCLGEIAQNVGNSADLAFAVTDRLPHFERLQPGELVLTLHHQFGRAANDPGALREPAVDASNERPRERLQNRFEAPHTRKKGKS